MRAAKIEKGVVVAVWEVPSLDAFAGVTLVDASTGGNEGDTWNGAAIVKKPRDVEAEKVSVRNQRDLLLAESDWTQCADISQATKDKWAPYRKALRDVPQQAGFPIDVIWPT